MADLDPETTYVQSEKSGKKYLILPHMAVGEMQGPTTLLGKGHFGTVSVAMTEDNDFVAAKFIELDKTNKDFEADMDEIEKETRIMKKIGRSADVISMQSNDPNKVKLCIIQPLLLGTELGNYWDKLLKQSKDPNNQTEEAKFKLFNKAVTSFIAAFEATQEIHAKNIIHGDLHGGNILYDPFTQRATVIDFGMSLELPEGEDKAYAKGTTIYNIHRAPETKKPANHREGMGEERLYYKSSDGFALAIDCGVSSEYVEYEPDAVGRESAQLLALFRDLSQEPMLGGKGKPQNRITLEEGLQRLKAIHEQIKIKKKIQLPQAEIKAIAEKFGKENSFKFQRDRMGLPENVKDQIHKLAQKIKQERKNAEKPAAVAPTVAPSSTLTQSYSLKKATQAEKPRRTATGKRPKK